MKMTYHEPVLLEESVKALHVQEDGIYVDATFGGGGHSVKLLEVLKGGKVLGFDQDEAAQKEAKHIHDDRFQFVKANFRYLKKYLRVYGIQKINGLLADLGVSSFQINTPPRGFAFRFDDAALDMRMNEYAGKTAEEVVNTASEQELKEIFEKYGEVRNAKTLAAAIVQARNVRRLKTASDIKAVTSRFARQNMANKYNARVFQALRVEVNDEMKALEDLLEQLPDCLAKGGRVVFITYHSIEDRLVKHYVNKGTCYGELQKDIYGNTSLPFQAINKKPVYPDEHEIKRNPRSRSAKMRIAEKI